MHWPKGVGSTDVLAGDVAAAGVLCPPINAAAPPAAATAGAAFQPPPDDAAAAAADDAGRRGSDGDVAAGVGLAVAAALVATGIDAARGAKATAAAGRSKLQRKPRFTALLVACLATSAL